MDMIDDQQFAARPTVLDPELSVNNRNGEFGRQNLTKA